MPHCPQSQELNKQWYEEDKTIPPFRAVFFGNTSSVGMNRLMGQELPPVLKKLDTALPGSDGFAVGEKV